MWIPLIVVGLFCDMMLDSISCLDVEGGVWSH